MSYKHFAEREAGRVSAQIKEIIYSVYNGEISVEEAKVRIPPLCRRYMFYRDVTRRGYRRRKAA